MAGFYNNNDHFDSREAENRINELTATLANNEDEYERAELNTLLALKSEIEDNMYGDAWTDGVTFMNARGLEDYTEESVGYLFHDNEIPNVLAGCIDMNLVAERMFSEINEIELNGMTYYYND